jgi:phosphoribosylformimino-5-aminoimidazole carboxamide ribotide isomerase
VILYPAIDLRGGRCVRLRQGDYAQETVFGDDPAAIARRWVDQGATFLHLVDLDGAREGRPINGEAVRAIVRSAGVPCQLGGGIREDAHLDEVLSWGIARVILGSKALENPGWCEAKAYAHPGKIALGVDARDGMVAVHGWLKTSDVSARDLVTRAASWPLAAVIYTDISRDGMMQGANVESTAALSRAVPHLHVIASGGVTTLDDLKRLHAAGVPGAIIGRALYEGRIALRDAVNCLSPPPSAAG